MGFPKGRRNYQERDMICGLREFEEETGYDKNDLINITNILPLEEILQDQIINLININIF